MVNPHKVTEDFEKALCEYTGAPYAVAVTSCTMALLLACKYLKVKEVTIPKRTYVSVPMSITHAGGKVEFRDEDWSGVYKLNPYPIFDSARWFTYGLFWEIGGRYYGGEPMGETEFMVCVSFHWSKTLGIGQGGAILHDSPEADKWFRKARFDGRTEGVAPKDDTFDMIGWHCYMSPKDAADGISRLSVLPKHNDPLPNSDYPDLGTLEIFTK